MAICHSMTCRVFLVRPHFCPGKTTWRLSALRFRAALGSRGAERSIPAKPKRAKGVENVPDRRMCSCLSTVRGSIKWTRYGKRLSSTNRSLAAPRRTDGIRAFSPSNTTSSCTASHWTRCPNGPFDGVFLRLFTPYFSASVWPQVSLIPTSFKAYRSPCSSFRRRTSADPRPLSPLASAPCRSAALLIVHSSHFTCSAAARKA